MKEELEKLKKALSEIQRMQSECVNEFGVVKNQYRYNLLMKKATEVKNLIDHMKKYCEV